LLRTRTLAALLQDTLSVLEASVAATPNAERYLHVFFSNKARCLGDVSTAAAVQCHATGTQ
jgi:hypothetical protein